MERSNTIVFNPSGKLQPFRQQVVFGLTVETLCFNPKREAAALTATYNRVAGESRLMQEFPRGALQKSLLDEKKEEHF